MHFLFEVLPIAVFFISYKLWGIFTATTIAIGASALQVLWSRYKNGKFETLPLITLCMLVILGGATLFFRNEVFIKWKPTALYWSLSLIFMASQYVAGKKPIIQRLLQDKISIPARAWQMLNISWALFFILMGFLNLYIAYHYSTTIWVNFKLFGTLALTMLFVILQSIYLSKHALSTQGTSHEHH